MKKVKPEYPGHDSQRCQIALFLSGKNPKDILAALKRVAKELEDDGNIRQGIILRGTLNEEIIRPQWGL